MGGVFTWDPPGGFIWERKVLRLPGLAQPIVQVYPAREVDHTDYCAGGEYSGQQPGLLVIKGVFIACITLSRV